MRLEHPQTGQTAAAARVGVLELRVIADAATSGNAATDVDRRRRGTVSNRPRRPRRYHRGRTLVAAAAACRQDAVVARDYQRDRKRAPRDAGGRHAVAP